MIEVTQHPLSPEHVMRSVMKDYNGAVVTFIGAVRGDSHGKKVLHLEYEAFQQMAEEKLRAIAQEIKTKWQLDDVAICHRTGHLEVGDIAVVIAVASPHRKEAFEACRYAIDRIKEIVPIWKKEVMEGGERWVSESP